MRINSAAVVLFFLIVICSQGSLSCNFLTKTFNSDACKTESFDYDIFGIAPFCRKFFTKLCDIFTNIFPISNGIGSIFGSNTKKPISVGGSVGAGAGVLTDGARPPTGANGASVASTDANVRPPAGPLVPAGPAGAVSTGDSVRPPGTVGGILMEPVKPVGGSDNLRPPPVITGPLVPTGGGGGAEAKPTGSVGGPIIPTGGLDAVSEDDSDGIISIENDYPEIDYDAPVEGKRT